MNRFATLLLASILVIAGVFTTPLSAQADELPDSNIATVLQAPDTSYINVRTGPGTEHTLSYTIPSGTDVKIGCWTDGSAVNGPYGTSTIWYQLSGDATEWVSDAYLYTGSNSAVTTRCPTPDAPKAKPKSKVYDRFGAVSLALEEAESFNLHLGADCTYFVSNMLWYGGRMPMTDEWTDSSKDESKWASKHFAPGSTKAAVNANEFVRYMERSGTATVTEIDWSDNTASNAELGDVIAYDWDQADGKPGADGTIDHLAIVTKRTSERYPFVSQHSPSQVNRYWSWSIGANDWIEHVKPGAKAYLVRIIK